MSHVLACGVPHRIAHRGTLEEVVSNAFSVSREFIQRRVDPENNFNFEEISGVVEECRIVVVDERDATLQAFGVPARRARRTLVMLIRNDECARIVFPPFVERVFMGVATEKKINLTRTCVMCYASMFVGGFFVGVICVWYSAINAHFVNEIGFAPRPFLN